MCCDAEFRVAVHLMRPYLDFERLSILVNHRCMEGLIVIRLFGSDIVIEFAWDVRKMHVHDSKHFVAGFNVIHKDAHSPQIADGVKIPVLALHFSVNGVNVLGSAGNDGLYLRFFEQAGQVGDDGIDFFLAFNSLGGQLFRNFVVLFGIYIPESQVFQLPFDLPDAQSICQRCKHIQRLLSYSQPQRIGERAQSPHIVQMLCKLYNHNPNIIPHG